MTLGEHEDWHAIVDALNRLAAALDERRWDDAAALFVPEAEAYGQRGVEAIVRDSLRRHLGGCGPSQHLLGNYRIDVDGDAATSSTYVRVLHQGAGELSDRTWDCLGVYRDRWVRTRVGWRMQKRVFEVRIAVGDITVLQPG